MPLTPEQKNQIIKQLQNHNRSAGLRTITLDDKSAIGLELMIDAGVFASDIMDSAIYLARFLYVHRQLFEDKDVLDMGCGAGTQGIVMGLHGARSVTFADISPKAIINTERNISSHNINVADIYRSDLFRALPIEKRYDVIVFNHPFFNGDLDDLSDIEVDIMLKRSMLGDTNLIRTFFENAHRYLRAEGCIVMPYFHFAGPENDPAVRAKEFGFEIEEYKLNAISGLQVGDFSIYIIQPTRASNPDPMFSKASSKSNRGFDRENVRGGGHQLDIIKK